MQKTNRPDADKEVFELFLDLSKIGIVNVSFDEKPRWLAFVREEPGLAMRTRKGELH